MAPINHSINHLPRENVIQSFSYSDEFRMLLGVPNLLLGPNSTS
jgi:hypothetical protein